MPSDAERQETRRALRAAVSAGEAEAAVLHARELLQSGRSADTMFCASAFASVAEQLVRQTGRKRLRTFVVRSVTVEPILPYISVEAVLAGYVLDVQVGGYGSYMEEMLSPQSALGQADADLVFVLLDLEDISGRLPELCADGSGGGVETEIQESVSRVGQMLRAYRTNHAGRIVLQGCVVPDRTSLGDVGEANLEFSLSHSVGELNRRLAALCRSLSDCVFFDVDQVAARYGRSHWRDARLFLASRLPVSAGAFAAFAEGLVRTGLALFRAPRKVLCTDLDNTLWGGVLGEDGPEGIATGSAFPGNCYLEYQRYLKRLSKRGILLAAVSKNNAADVEEAFNLRSADLALRLDDFVAKKISWDDKVTALRELATELSLGLDSFVFVDDNPVECEAVRQHVPEISVITAVPDEPWKLMEMLAREPFFDSLAVTEDDLSRSQEYKAQAQRNALSNSTQDRDQFLHSLEIVCTFVSALEAPLARSVQLLGKTNQFNLTTRRYSAAEVERFAAEPDAQAIAIRVRDRFGDAGVVGLVLAKRDGNCCCIDSLLLSCRVIGRGIETALLSHVAERAAKMGLRWLVGEYIQTRKNTPCANFYTDHGFTRDTASATTDSVYYRLDLKKQVPMSPSWLTLEGNEIL